MEIVSENSFSQKITGLLNKHPVILQFLKFVGIGFLITGADFLFFNFLSKSLGISKGLVLGAVNAVSFTVAVIHSFVWNSNWTFGAEQQISIWKVFWRSVAIGVMGVLGVTLALLGGKVVAPAYYFLAVLVALLVSEVAVWKIFKLPFSFKANAAAGQTVLAFVVVSLIGTLINSGLIALITQHWMITANLDLNKNIAKVIATACSLFWNFIGYKLVVFKK
jgi:putative flippase GtrA